MRLGPIGKLAPWILAALVLAMGESSCNKDLVWEKVKGMKPEFAKELETIYKGIDSQGIVAACFEKCKRIDCNAFIINLEKSYCARVEWSGNDFTLEHNVTFYHKICLTVPKTCLNKYWQVERTLGAILLDPMSVKVQPDVVTRAKCYEACIQKGESCQAAQFQAGHALSIGDTSGTCFLLTTERETKPQAYRASMYREEYLENQCHNITKTSFCSYGERRNLLMPFSDVKISGLNAKQCEQRCDENRDGFLCRAYGVEHVNSNTSSCYLYSEDTIGSGVSSLVKSANSTYKEREPCINMKVHCTESSVSVELKTDGPFVGRIYASGYSEVQECNTWGQGENVTIFNIPLQDKKNSSSNALPCGLVKSFKHGNRSRAVVWSTVIVQFNPRIQLLGDQAVRVGCIFAEDSVPSPQNISVHTGFSFTDPNAGLPPVVSVVMNTSSNAPTVSMNILDASGNPANVTHLGQKLILKIQTSPNEGPFDISAGSLIASSYNWDQSIMLLDEPGCPTSDVFPALHKDPSNNRSLIAEFYAFKFPNSQYVRFDIIVKFCLEACQPVKCKNNRLSFGRKRREIVRAEVLEKNSIGEDKPFGNSTVDELPLQYSIIVEDSKSADQNIVPNPLKSKSYPDTFVIVDSDRMDSQFCMDANLLMCLVTLLLIIQIVLIGSCVFAVRSYRRMAIRAEEDRADILARHLHGYHIGSMDLSRRVHWADNNRAASR